MPRLPPAEKLPLAARKNLRDEWDNKKEEIEKNLSDLLGVAWTVDVDPKTLYPYAEENSYGQHSPGNLIADYITSAHGQLKYLIESRGAIYRDDLNELAHAHVITIDYTDDKSVYYCGALINEQGQLVILFREGALGTNINSALEENNTKKALQTAPTDTKPLNFLARLSLAEDYEPKIADLQAKLEKVYGKKLTLNPNTEANFAKLKETKDSAEDWDQGFGRVLYSYFEGVESQLSYKGFGTDDMLQEGLQEAVEKDTFEIRVVDKISSGYSEVVIEDGVLYIQVPPQRFGTNTHYTGENILDLL